MSEVAHVGCRDAKVMSGTRSHAAELRFFALAGFNVCGHAESGLRGGSETLVLRGVSTAVCATTGQESKRQLFT